MMEDLALMLKSALPIDAIDRLPLGPTDGLAVVWVDISERPDLQELVGRHHHGGGYCIWFYGNPGRRNMLVGLRVEMCQPPHTVFHLAFNVQHYRNQLSLIARTGKLWIVAGPPPAHLVGTQEMTAQDVVQKVVNYSGPGVTIELEPHLVAELRRRLEGWKRTRYDHHSVNVMT